MPSETVTPQNPVREITDEERQRGVARFGTKNLLPKDERGNPAYFRAPEYKERQDGNTFFFTQNGRHYEVEQSEIARGGMGKIHRGWLLSNDDKTRQIAVAVKMPFQPIGGINIPADAKAQLLRETGTQKSPLRTEYETMTNAAENTRGQAVINLDYIEKNEPGFLENNAIVMELMHDKDITGGELIRTQPNTMTKEHVAWSLGVLGSLAQALDAQTKNGLLMTDSKPENWYVDTTTGTVKLVDGSVVMPVNMSNSPKGTIPYMAPEQFRVQKLTPETMSYIFTLNIFSVLTGQDYYRGANIKVIRDDILHGINRDLSTNFSGDRFNELYQKIKSMVYVPVDAQTGKPLENYDGPVPEGMISLPALDNARTVLDYALHRDQTQRYPSCVSVVKALQSALFGNPSRVLKPEDFPALEIKTEPKTPPPAEPVADLSDTQPATHDFSFSSTDLADLIKV